MNNKYMNNKVVINEEDFLFPMINFILIIALTIAGLMMSLKIDQQIKNLNSRIEKIENQIQTEETKLLLKNLVNYDQ